MNSGAAGPAFPAACRRRSTFLTCRMVWSVRVAGGGALGVGERGPRGAQVPDRGDELVLPSRDRLPAFLAGARAVVDVAPPEGAAGVRAGLPGVIYREPPPPPPIPLGPTPGPVPRPYPRHRPPHPL